MEGNSREGAFWIASLMGVIAGISLWCPIENFMGHAPHGNGWLLLFSPAFIVALRCHLEEGRTPEIFFKEEAMNTEEYRLGIIVNKHIYRPHAALRSWFIVCTAMVSLHVYAIYYFTAYQLMVLLVVVVIFAPLFYYNKLKNVPEKTYLRAFI